jgi:hypothetical protein
VIVDLVGCVGTGHWASRPGPLGRPYQRDRTSQAGSALWGQPISALANATAQASKRLVGNLALSWLFTRSITGQCGLFLGRNENFLLCCSNILSTAGIHGSELTSRPISKNRFKVSTYSGSFPLSTFLLPQSCAPCFVSRCGCRSYTGDS